MSLVDEAISRGASAASRRFTWLKCRAQLYKLMECLVPPLLRALLAQPASTLVDTLGAHLGGWFAADLAGDQRCFISGEHRDRLPLRFSFSYCHHLQAQFRWRAVIILVEKLLPRAQDSSHLHPHTLVAEFPIWIGGVGDPCNLKFTQVAAALQPSSSEEIIQGLQCGLRGEFQVHPILWLITSFHQEMHQPGCLCRPLVACRGSLCSLGTR